MNGIDQRVAMLARRQYGVVTRRQARRLGATEHAIDWRLANGRWEQVLPAVFRVGGAPETFHQRCFAAASWMRSDGMVSHASAATLYRLDGVPEERLVHVTVAYERSLCAQSGFRVHRSQLIEPADLRTVDGVVVSAPARTVLDLAGVLRGERLEAAFETFRRRGLLSLVELATRFETLGGRGRPGSAAVRTLLRAHVGQPALESRLEVRAARLLRNSRLAPPVRQHRLIGGDGNRYRLDFAWPEHRVAVETQGFRWHGNRLSWKQDAARTTAIESQRWRLLVVTWDDVTLRADATLDRIAAALRAARAA